MRKTFLIQVFFLMLQIYFASHSNAQSSFKDSLQQVIKNSTGLERVNMMLDLASHLADENLYDSTCLYWANTAEKNADALNENYLVARAKELKARYYFNKSAWDESIREYEASRSLADKIPVLPQRNEIVFKSLIGIAEVYNYMGDYVTALDYRLKGLKLIDSVPINVNERVSAYISVANDFRHLNQRTKALEYLNQVKDEVAGAAGNYQLDYFYEYYQDLLLNDQVEEAKKMLKRYDSGVAHFKLSAAQRLEFSGNAQKLHGQYELYHAKNFKAALAHFKNYLNYSQQLDNQTHIAIAYNKIGITCDSLKDYTAAIDAFKRSFDICMQEQVIDYAYKSAQHLSTLYERTGDFSNAYRYSSAAYSLKEKLDTESKLRELNQLEAKYQASKKEKEITDLKLANAEHAIKESKQKQVLSNTRFIIAVVVLISMFVLFIVYRYYHKRQLKEIAIRNRISQDLHDDIGATLSSIQIFGELAGSTLEKDAGHSKKMIGEMTGQTKELMSRMSDVIWSMKPSEEEKNSITARIKNYSSELLSAKGISCALDIDEEISKKINNPIVRKNILLIIKEAMNNIAKYSKADKVNISLLQQDKAILLCIADNGTGFSNADEFRVTASQTCSNGVKTWVVHV